MADALALAVSWQLDPFCGFLVEVFDVRKTPPVFIYDRMQTNYNHERPLLGALKAVRAAD